MTPLLPVLGAPEPWIRVPVIVDASALIADILRFARLGRPPNLLAQSRAGWVNLYATEQIRDEVRSRLPRAAPALPQHDIRRALWFYERAVSFIDISPSSARDDRIAALASRDAEDAATGTLAELIGPCLVVATDRDLIETGVARADWADLMHWAAEVGRLYNGIQSAALMSGVFAQSSAAAAAAVRDAARRRPFLTGLVLGAVICATVTHLHRALRDPNTRLRFASLAQKHGGRLGELFVQAADFSALVEGAAFVPHCLPSQQALIARILACAPAALSIEEITEKAGLPTEQVRTLLRSPIYSSLGDGAYRLGRRGPRLAETHSPFSELQGSDRRDHVCHPQGRT